MSPSSQTVSGVSVLPIVINTRPVERAQPLTRHLQAAGFSVVDIPMLAIQPRCVVDDDIDIMRQWLAGEYQVLVVVSPTAAASGLAVWQTLKQERMLIDNKPATKTSNLPSHIVAVGDATAAVLQADKQLEGHTVLQPLVANNEGMLAMPEIEHLQADDKLLVWRGLGGRRLLVDTLHARGVHIDSIAWYERTMPKSAAVEYQQWSQQFDRSQNESLKLVKPIVIISSGTAFEHWTQVVEQAQTTGNEHSTLNLVDYTYVVLGVRLAGIVAKQQLSYVQVEDLDPKTILTAIQANADLF